MRKLLELKRQRFLRHVMVADGINLSLEKVYEIFKFYKALGGLCVP